MDAIALTDHGNLFGAIELYNECKAASLNPIIGYEAYVAPGKRNEREARRRGDAGFHLTLLASNRTGFQNLNQKASIAFMRATTTSRASTRKCWKRTGRHRLPEWLRVERVQRIILKDQREEARQLAEWFAGVFGKHFYVEIQNNGLDIQRLCAEGPSTSPIVSVCRWWRRAMHIISVRPTPPRHDVLLCINTGRTRADENRMRYGSDQFYVRPPERDVQTLPQPPGRGAA